MTYSTEFVLKKALALVLPAFSLFTIYNLTSGFFVRMLPGNPLGYGVNGVLDGIGLWGFGVGYIANSCPGCYVYADVYLDFLTLALLLVLFYAVYRNYSILRAVQVGSFMVLMLPLEILLSDGWEFNLHVTRFQAYFNIVPWFTNADLLWVALGVFAFASISDLCGLFSAKGPAWRRRRGL